MAQSEFQASKEGTIRVPVIAGLDQRAEQGRMNLDNFSEVGSNYQRYQHNLQHLPESFFQQRGTYPSLSGLQRRIMGKVFQRKLDSPVSSIFQFWSPFGYGAGFQQIGTELDYGSYLTGSQDIGKAIQPYTPTSGIIPSTYMPINYDVPQGAPSATPGSPNFRKTLLEYPDINFGTPPIVGAYNNSVVFYNAFPSVSTFYDNYINEFIKPAPPLSPMIGTYACYSPNPSGSCDTTKPSAAPAPAITIGSYRGFMLGQSYDGFGTYTCQHSESESYSSGNFVYPSWVNPDTMAVVFIGIKRVQATYNGTTVTTPVWFNFTGMELRNGSPLVEIDIPPQTDLSPKSPMTTPNQYDGCYTQYVFSSVRVYLAGYVVQ